MNTFIVYQNLSMKFSTKIILKKKKKKNKTTKTKFKLNTLREKIPLIHAT